MPRCPRTSPANPGTSTSSAQLSTKANGDACVIAADGRVLEEHRGRVGKQRSVSDLASAIHHNLCALDRPTLRRLLIEDDSETVALCSVPGPEGLRVVLIADAGPRMGGVLAEARRVAQALRISEGGA